MFKISFILLLFPITSFAAFAPCYNHGTGGQEPAGAARFYQIQSEDQIIRADNTLGVVDPATVFHLIVEDVQFTSYKCWDKDKNLTGFDVEHLTKIIAKAGYTYVEFVLRPWSKIAYKGVDQVSLLIDLDQSLGDAVSAGMSITDDRKKLVEMIGPIYKAGKKLMARKDNAQVQSLKSELLLLPQGDYATLKGLSILVQAGTIRADFFKELALQNPKLVVYKVVENDLVKGTFAKNKLTVVETTGEVLEAYVANKMTGAVHGQSFDLVMVDTGSSLSMIQDGTLDQETEIVTGNLGTDANLGFVFGLGDGVSMRKNDPRLPTMTALIAEQIRLGFIDQLVAKWFQDENAADHSWASKP